LVFAACSREKASPDVSPKPGVVTSTPSVAPNAPPKVVANSPSIYGLKVNLRDEKGRVTGLDRFRGHPVLVTMFYGSCATACPLLTTELKRIEQKLPERTKDNLRVMMVSFDEARDTPEVLSRIMTERALDTSRWSLASAPDEEARGLAGVLGIRYRKLDNGEFFHSSGIVLLDPEGRPIAKLSGVGEDLDPLVAALGPHSS
jgi:protein SCO1/2